MRSSPLMSCKNSQMVVEKQLSLRDLSFDRVPSETNFVLGGLPQNNERLQGVAHTNLEKIWG